MALPQGFDPTKMSFGNISTSNPVIGIPRNDRFYDPRTSSTYMSSSASATASSGWSSGWSWGKKRSAWSRFNNGVAGIGNWFADKSSDILGWLSLGVMAILGITALIFIIKGFTEGFWTGVITTIVAGILGVIAFYIAAFVIVVAANIILFAFRILFWNGWTLLATLTVAAAAMIAGASGAFVKSPAPVVETVQTQDTSTIYRCTAQVLNIRNKPSAKNSRVIGTLKYGDEIDVLDYEGDFAKINYNGAEGYVSTKYIERDMMRAR